jgi:hypothetical protein
MREQNYLRDVFLILLERAREAANHARESKASGSELDAKFQDGRAQGYYEVLSTMTNQLGAFGIPREAVGLSEDFDVERELL